MRFSLRWLKSRLEASFMKWIMGLVKSQRCLRYRVYRGGAKSECVWFCVCERSNEITTMMMMMMNELEHEHEKKLSCHNVYI